MLCTVSRSTRNHHSKQAVTATKRRRWQLPTRTFAACLRSYPDRRDTKQNIFYLWTVRQKPCAPVIRFHFSVRVSGKTVCLRHWLPRPRSPTHVNACTPSACCVSYLPPPPHPCAYSSLCTPPAAPTTTRLKAIGKTCDELCVKWQKEYFGAW